jgi:hypothetical protein
MEIKGTSNVSVDLAKKIIEDYNNSLTMVTISKKYNIYYGRINKVLITNNINKRSISDNNKLADYKKSRESHFLDDKPALCNELKKLYAVGMSLTAIGIHFNVSHVTIKNWLIKLGVRLRTIAESNSSNLSKENKKITMRRKYGVENPMQLINVHHKAMKSGFRYKDVIIEGKKFTVQGYEPQALKYLINSGINVNSICVGVNVPTISYKFDGKYKKYFPDFFHNETNTVYEIKSVWTYSQQQRKNIAKAKATAKQGYKHITLIFDNKGINLVNTLVTS